MMKLNFLLLSAAALFNAATASDNEAVDLRTAGDYAILAKTGISTVPDSVITGHIGVSPIAATAITGFGLTMHLSGHYSTCTQVTGNAYAASYSQETKTALIIAVGDMQTAYEDAASRAADEDEIELDENGVDQGQKYNELKGGLIGGETMKPGVYTFTTDILITADVTLDGNADDVFIIRSSGSLKQAASTNVNLINGAKAENVFWQVADQVLVGASAVLNGILLVKTKADFENSSTLNGRVLAQTACNLKVTTIDSSSA